jgi:hypothetical protein
MRVAARTVAVELFLPLHHIAFAAVFLDELVHLIAALARAPAAFDAQHIELAFDIAEYEVGSMARAYSITSSARASSVGGTSRPSAFAVVKLMTRSNLVGCSTGRSAGLAPRKILST